jgi:hypothetical protein
MSEHDGTRPPGAPQAHVRELHKIVSFENRLPFAVGIDTLRDVLKEHIGTLATDPPDRDRYERAIKNIEHAMGEWKAHNPDAPDPRDDVAWAKNPSPKWRTPPEWKARYQKHFGTTSVQL